MMFQSLLVLAFHFFLVMLIHLGKKMTNLTLESSSNTGMKSKSQIHMTSLVGTMYYDLKVVHRVEIDATK